MAYSQSWFEETTARRCIIVRALVSISGAADTPIYFSNVNYSTTDLDVNILPILGSGFSVTESLSIEGGVSISYGDIEINNPDGTYDSYLDPTMYVWTNREVTVWYGDADDLYPNWSFLTGGFVLVYNGLIADIDSRDRNTLNLKVRDKMERLNSPLTEATFADAMPAYGVWADGNPNKDEILPMSFGEVFNIEPFLIDPSTLEYLCNHGRTEELIEVRDNGIPISTTAVSVTTGKFKLVAPLYGTITMSIKGMDKSVNLSNGALVDGTYVNNVANLVALITTQFGKASTRLVGATDLDLTQLAALQIASPQPVGILIRDRENVLSICQALASSIGGQLYFTRAGKLQILIIGTYTSTPNRDITDSDIIVDTLQISQRLPAEAGKRLAYAKNWTVQPDLTSSIPSSHKKMFKKEWYYEKNIVSGVKTTYRLNGAPPIKETMLINTADAQAEALRLATYYSVPRTIYRFTCRTNMMTLELGQQVTLYHKRFGLSAGKVGQVYSLSPNWATNLIDVEVII